MTSIGRPEAANRLTPDFMRKTALVAGILYLLTFISSIPAVFLLGPVLTDPNFVIGGSGAEPVRFGALLDIVNCLAAIGTAVALYAVMRRQNQGFAIGFVASRIFEAAVLMIGTVSHPVDRHVAATGCKRSRSIPARDHPAHARRRPRLVLRPGNRRPRAQRRPARLAHAPFRPGRSLIPVVGLIGAPLFASWIVGYILGITDGGSAWHAIGGRTDLRLGARDRSVHDVQGLPQGRTADGRGWPRLTDDGPTVL